MRIEFRILGPLELSADGSVLSLGSPKQRALLALLLIHANETVSRDRLIEELWAEAAPATVESAFHNYLSRLRRVLESAGAGETLVREPHGYRLRVEPDDLDVTRFGRLVREGSEALGAGKAELAADRLGQALALWRGPALADLQSERFAITAGARLEEERLSALEQRLEADLELGRHRQLVGELESLVSEHPYRERLRAQLMLALYRSARQAEALRVYQEARRTLSDELGLEPSQELKELEQAMLRQDPALIFQPSEKRYEPEPHGEPESQRPPPPSALAQPREERKVVTVLFADAVDSTEQADGLDPEDVRAFQDRYWAALRAEIERHGGTLEKFIGDAVVALFGAPVAHEDDPERAVRAALAIREWAQEQPWIQVRIGITTGEALVRLGAQPLTGEGMASGDVVNTASRLQTAAPANGILVDERSYRSTRQMIDYADKEAISAKGKPKPVRVWEALQARSRFGVDLIQHARTPLIGRERELGVLIDALARVRAERSPQLITLVGVPGIGKSRLVYELMRKIADDPSGKVTWRQGRSLPYGDGVSFWALAEIVKVQLGILETDTDADARPKLERAVAALLPDQAEAEWVERHLRPLVGLAGDGEASAEREGEAFAAWRRLVEALADTRPAVFVFEDLHWADEGLLDFVDSLVEWIRSVPMLVVATARPELLQRRPSWAGGKANATTLSLAPLSEEETARLVCQLVDGAKISHETEQALVAHAAGNPLYAEQYARMSQERGYAEHLPPPETVQGIIAARLDDLSTPEKVLLQNASVVGEVFWDGAIIAVDGVERSEVASCLHALQRKDFIQRARRSSVERESEYAFGHVLLCDVAYSQIPRAARAEKHRRAAAWIESLGRVEDHAEMLAHHYRSALELARAAGRSTEALAEAARLSARRAGDRALTLNAFGSAADYYEQALALWPQGDLDYAQLLFARAQALYGRGAAGGADALELARTALYESGDVESAAQADAMLADVWWDRGRQRESEEYLRRALALARDRPPSPARAYVLSSVARARMRAASRPAEYHEAIDVAREALSIAEALDLQDIRADALITLGAARSSASGGPDGISELEHGLQIALDHKALFSIWRGYNNLAMAVGSMGQLSRHDELLRAAVDLANRLGAPDRARPLRAQLIWAEHRHGRWENALHRADEFIAECEAGSPHRQELGMRLLRAKIRVARGDTDVALADCERALALARESHDPSWLCEALGNAVEIYAEAGHLNEAHGLADEVLSHGPAPDLDEVVCKLIWQAERIGLDERRIRPFVPAIHSYWRRVAELMLTKEFEELANLLAEVGFKNLEAEARLRAAEALVERGCANEATAQLRSALKFFRFVGATRYIRETETLLAEVQRETEAATRQSFP